MLRIVAICAVTATALLATGCGSSDDSTSGEDEEEIRALVADVNQATEDQDASAFCLLIQPSAIEDTFVDIDRCVKETKQILKQAGEQPSLEIESVEVDGDLAEVTFTGGTGSEAKLVREGGKWYIPIDQSEVQSGTDSEG